MNIRDVEPKEVFKFFDEILKIPRPSKKEEKIVQYLIDFAKSRGLEYKVDSVGNVVIKKPATPGMENRKPVVLQAHVDMVAEKDSSVEHDFEKDPIQAYVDGEWIRAKGTTLGADDGIGVATILAILDSDKIKHPQIEGLFTIDEETGLTGAFALEEGFFEGKILINLDSEDWGEIFIGSAGGMDTEAEFGYMPKPVPEGVIAYKIVIDDLNGGHSGDEIHKGYANAIKLLDRFLIKLLYEMPYYLAHFHGGKLRNAIPRDAYAIIAFKPEFEDVLKEMHLKYYSIFKDEYGKVEPKITFTVEKVDLPGRIIDDDVALKLLWSLYACPHGVYAWSKEIPGLVETSTNLATVRTEESRIIVGTSQRSSKDSAKDDIATMVKAVFLLAGAEVSHSDGYPGWAPNLESEILKLTVDTFKRLFKKEPKVRAIHAGLECGLFLEKYPYLDMISIGPTIKGAHTPEERLHIPSVREFWQLMLEILQNIPEDKKISVSSK